MLTTISSIVLLTQQVDQQPRPSHILCDQVVQNPIGRLVESQFSLTCNGLAEILGRLEAFIFLFVMTCRRSSQNKIQKTCLAQETCTLASRMKHKQENWEKKKSHQWQNAHIIFVNYLFHQRACDNGLSHLHTLHILKKNDEIMYKPYICLNVEVICYLNKI